MRPVADLLELPFTFTQRPLLRRDDFRKAARERGLGVSEFGLEGFHRLGLLVPFARVRRDGREIAAAVRRDDPFVWELAHQHETHRPSLEVAAATGRIFDPAEEPFAASHRFERRIGTFGYRSSEYLYSHYQLLAVPMLKAALPFMETRRPGVATSTRLDINRFTRQAWKAEAQELRRLLVPLTALEPLFHSRITGSLRLGAVTEFDRYDRWRADLGLMAMLKWLSVDASWLRTTASRLLNRANAFDPLGDWIEVIRRGAPKQWDSLRGDARSAIDFRIAAELFLRYYDDLAQKRRAPALPKPRGYVRREFDRRLNATGPVHPTLTRFGLSPHPRVILVLEGATELAIVPRLMEKFKIPTDDEYISIEDAEGVDRDLSPLVAFAIAPKTVVDDDGRYLRPTRPLTRLLVIADAEGTLSTSDQRREKRTLWIERMLRTLPAEHRTPAVEKALGDLVYVETWRRSGQSFEFAHFTARQLAVAIARIDPRDRQPSLPERISQVAAIRAKGGNLKAAMWVGSKPALATELWPVLERKIDRAAKSGREQQIPIVRVIDRAVDLARDLPRSNLVIGLREGT